MKQTIKKEWELEAKSSYKIVTLNDLMREVELHKEITFIFNTNLYCLKQMIYPKKDRLYKTKEVVEKRKKAL
jgi:hypothetical protein